MRKEAPAQIHGNARLTIKQREAVRRLHHEERRTIASLSRDFGVSPDTILKWVHRESPFDRRMPSSKRKRIVEEDYRQAIIEYRKQHPNHGKLRIAREFREACPHARPSTILRVLQPAGIIVAISYSNHLVRYLELSLIKAMIFISLPQFGRNRGSASKILWISRARLALALVLPLIFATGSGVAEAERVVVLREGDIAGWEEETFSGKTLYETFRLEDRSVVRATSRGTASGLYFRLRIDLDKTPFLHWSWRVDGTLGDIDERTKAGDDYSARVYVIRSHPVFLWRTRAVNYVWASARTAGETWPNAYTDRAQHVAVRSGNTQAGQWVAERRDVRADFRELFGESVRYVDAVAIMTDTDNTGGTAVAYYGDITFSSE